jgi:NAD(P)H-nitrite reductase large subunit
MRRASRPVLRARRAAIRDGESHCGRLTDDPAPRYEGSFLSTKLKVTGVDLFSAGDFADAPDRDEIVLRDASRSVYKRLVLKDDRSSAP